MREELRIGFRPGNEHGLVLFREDKLRYIPWTAVGMVTRESDAEDKKSSDG